MQTLWLLLRSFGPETLSTSMAGYDTNSLFHERNNLHSCICHIKIRFLPGTDRQKEDLKPLFRAMEMTCNYVNTYIYTKSRKKFCIKRGIYTNFMYNTHNYFVIFCRAISGHWFANVTLETVVRSSWQQEILEVACPGLDS